MPLALGISLELSFGGLEGWGAFPLDARFFLLAPRCAWRGEVRTAGCSRCEQLAAILKGAWGSFRPMFSSGQRPGWPPSPGKAGAPSQSPPEPSRPSALRDEEGNCAWPFPSGWVGAKNSRCSTPPSWPAGSRGRHARKRKTNAVCRGLEVLPGRSAPGLSGASSRPLAEAIKSRAQNGSPKAMGGHDRRLFLQPALTKINMVKGRPRAAALPMSASTGSRRLPGQSPK